MSRTESTLGAGGVDGAEPTVPGMPSRYDDLGVIASGSFGEVRRVRDRSLDRIVAMKILRRAVADVPSTRRRFEEEARVTAGLQHPAIVPVHDRGVLQDGRPFFTMPEVAGRTLAALVAEVHAASEAGWGTTADGWTLRRLVGALEVVCQAVGFAHARGVLHRDLKPSNVLVGAFGEVLVVDWGLARAGDEPSDPAATAGGTADGAVLGTPGYMAPEQRRGEVLRHGPATDVYALGAMLHEFLRGAPPGRTGPRLPAAPVELESLAAAAFADDPGQRPAASELATALRAWLEGRRRHDEALRLLAALEPVLEAADAARRDAADLARRALEQLNDVRPSDPLDRKRPGWESEDAAQAALDAAEVLEARYVEGLHAALHADPDLAEARARLVAHYKARLVRAEQRGDALEAARVEIRLRSHAGPADLAWLGDEARLTLLTDPPGARVTLARIVQERIWRTVPAGELGVTPLCEARLPRGLWIVHIESPGRVPVSYPVQVGRGEHADGVPPGASEPLPIVLPERVEGGRYVPAGWFGYGGDPEAPDALPAGRVWVDAFVIGELPVTNAEYAQFLNAVADAERWLPVEQVGLSEAGHALFVRRAGRWTLAEGLSGGLPLRPDAPVICVDVHAARAYATWRAETDGLPWRLPHGLEWEKAARGVDRRRFPWGDFFDAGFTRMQHSVAGAPSLAAAGEIPWDVSPYGVRDLGGNVRDWCEEAFRKGPPEEPRVQLERVPDDAAWHVVRGGSWSSGPNFCRVAGRLVAAPGARLTSLGFRLARSVGLG